MNKPKIGLVGYFGWGNFGDELFVRAHRQHLSDLVDLEVVHDILEAPYFSCEANDRLSSFDGFLIGGGDLVNPRALSTLYWREEYLRKPVFLHSIGCPSITIQQSASLTKLKRFFSSDSIKHINLRDTQSKAYFDKVIAPRCDTVASPDAVCALAIPTKRKSNTLTLGVVLRAHRSVDNPDYPEVRRAADEAKALGYTIKLIVAGNGRLGSNDFELTKAFAKEDEEILFSENLDDICSAIGSCSLLLSMKFHVVVVGALYGVPAIQLSSTQKNSNLFNYLQRPDLRRNHLDHSLWRAIPPIPAPIHSILSRRLKRDAAVGYDNLVAAIRQTYSL